MKTVWREISLIFSFLRCYFKFCNFFHNGQPGGSILVSQPFISGWQQPAHHPLHLQTCHCRHINAAEGWGLCTGERKHKKMWEGEIFVFARRLNLKPYSDKNDRGIKAIMKTLKSNSPQKATKHRMCEKQGIGARDQNRRNRTERSTMQICGRRYCG